MKKPQRNSSLSTAILKTSKSHILLTGCLKCCSLTTLCKPKHADRQDGISGENVGLEAREKTWGMVLGTCHFLTSLLSLNKTSHLLSLSLTDFIHSMHTMRHLIWRHRTRFAGYDVNRRHCITWTLKTILHSVFDTSEILLCLPPFSTSSTCAIQDPEWESHQTWLLMFYRERAEWEDRRPSQGRK